MDLYTSHLKLLELFSLCASSNMNVNMSFCKLAQDEYTGFEHLVLLETLLAKREAYFKVLRAIKLKKGILMVFILLINETSKSSVAFCFGL